jgi:hypothetical protein
MSYICIGDCYPPKEMFPFWDLITGNAPVNDYSILGYQMLVLADIMIITLIPMMCFFMYVILIKELPKLIPGKFDMNGRLVKKHE